MKATMLRRLTRRLAKRKRANLRPALSSTMRLLLGDSGLLSALVLPRLLERVQHLLDRSIMLVTLAANIVGLLSVISHLSDISHVELAVPDDF